MPTVRFTGRFDWIVRRFPRVVRVYLPGMVQVVTGRCAKAAIEAGKAELMKGSKDEPSKG